MVFISIRCFLIQNIPEEIFNNDQEIRDVLMELINSVAMQLQSDFDDGDIGHPTGKVNEFIKENFQVDLLNIEQENKINFSLQM
jgi:thioredoxin-related protein